MSSNSCVECAGKTAPWLIGVPRVSDYHRCRRCGLIMAEYRIEASGSRDNDTFRKEFIANVDNSDSSGAMYPKVGYEDPEAMSRVLLGRVSSILEAHGSGVGGPIAYLEVGCANGYLVNAVRKAFPGSRVLGVDPSPVASRKGRDLFGVEVIVGTIEDVPVPEGAGFDLIVIFGNLQLHANPLATIRQAWELLRPGGLLAFDYKNPSSSPRLICRAGSRIPAVARHEGFARLVNHAMRHIRVTADKTAMRRHVEEAGFHCREISTFPPRLLAFSSREASVSKGVKGVVWRVLEALDRVRNQRAWVQIVCRKPLATPADG